MHIIQVGLVNESKVFWSQKMKKKVEKHNLNKIEKFAETRTLVYLGFCLFRDFVRLGFR